MRDVQMVDGAVVEVLRPRKTPKMFLGEDDMLDVTMPSGGHYNISIKMLAVVIEKAEKYDAINTPELYDYLEAAQNEALHQREKWGTNGDEGKTDADWFWLVGYLAGKALHNPPKVNMTPVDAMLHRLVALGAAVANWHAAVVGDHTRMRPGTR
jgi:hypothetical protein